MLLLTEAVAQKVCETASVLRLGGLKTAGPACGVHKPEFQRESSKPPLVRWSRGQIWGQSSRRAVQHHIRIRHGSARPAGIIVCVKPIRTDFRGYEGKFVAIDARTGEVVIAKHDPRVVLEKANGRNHVVVRRPSPPAPTSRSTSALAETADPAPALALPLQGGSAATRAWGSPYSGRLCRCPLLNGGESTTHARRASSIPAPTRSSQATCWPTRSASIFRTTRAKRLSRRRRGAR